MSRPAKVLFSGALLAVAVLASACGTEKVSVPQSSNSVHKGAVLFNQRCGGCHTLSYAGTHGSAQNVRTAQFNNGPNFDIRCERPVARVLYAITNGGFSGVVMPQNIVVGQQAIDVAEFVAKYSGRKAPTIPGAVKCSQKPIGSVSAALAPAPTTTSTTSTGPSSGTGTSTSTTSTSTTSTSTTSTSATGSNAAGKAVFTSAGCSSCHTLAAAGASGTIGPNLDTRLRPDCATAASKRIRGATLAKCIRTAITNPYAYLPSGYKAGVMPNSFGKTLTPTQLQALVSFLQSSAK
ncbi:MAG TPA: cytochrome c [Solirubrobacteraceae bacterium]|nr:cytochrome c [Solirubrobacteraceae bacterium]